MSSGPDGESDRPRRVFYALWPTDAVRDALAERIVSLAAAAPARWVPPANLHLTLWFVGAAVPALLQQLLNAPAIPGAAFTLALTRLRYRNRRQLLWVEPEGPVPALAALAASLRDSAHVTIEPAALSLHVTLGRKLVLKTPIPAEIEPVAWPVDSVALFESVLQPYGPPRYHQLKHWPLRSMPAAGVMK